ncbi:26388_t:CDS:2, partial [Dentiscutata erythropus]
GYQLLPGPSVGDGTSDQLLPDFRGIQLLPGPHLRDSTCSISVDSEHADLTICHFWENLKLRNDLDAESIELLRISSKYQAQKVQNDYEDLMKTPCNKHFLNSANNEIMAKRSVLPDLIKPLLTLVNDDENDNVPDPNEIISYQPTNVKSSLGKSVEDIFTMNLSKNLKHINRRKG